MKDQNPKVIPKKGILSLMHHIINRLIAKAKMILNTLIFLHLYGLDELEVPHVLGSCEALLGHFNLVIVESLTAKSCPVSVRYSQASDVIGLSGGEKRKGNVEGR